MKIRKRLTRGGILLLLTPFLLSCKVHFTHGTKQDLESNDVNLKKIQYYNSKDIELKRFIDKSETKVASGEVQTNQGRYIEIIRIDKNTPGICDSVGEEALFIRFERGEGKVLRFKRDDSVDDHYILHADQWDPNDIDEEEVPVLESSSNYASVGEKEFTGKIEYGGETYYTRNYSEKPKLKIKKKNTSTTRTETRDVKGIEVE